MENLGLAIVLLEGLIRLLCLMQGAAKDLTYLLHSAVGLK